MHIIFHIKYVSVFSNTIIILHNDNNEIMDIIESLIIISIKSYNIIII